MYEIMNIFMYLLGASAPYIHEIIAPLGGTAPNGCINPFGSLYLPTDLRAIFAIKPRKVSEISES